MRTYLLPVAAVIAFSAPALSQEAPVLAQSELVTLCLTDDTGACATSIDAYFSGFSADEVDPAIGAFVDELTAYAVLCEEPPVDPNSHIAAAIQLAAEFSSTSELLYSIAETVDACQIEGTASIGDAVEVPSAA